MGEGARVGNGDDLTPNSACPEHLASGLVLAGKKKLEAFGAFARVWRK